MSSGDADELERQTRKGRIDPKLQARGWSVVSADSSRTLSPEAVTEYETANSPGEASSWHPGPDYVRLSR
jgi:hypothetical protein